MNVKPPVDSKVQKRKVAWMLILGIPAIALLGYLSHRIILGGPTSSEPPEIQRVNKLAQSKDKAGLQAALKDQNPLVAAAAVEGLASVGGPGIKQELEPLITQDSRGQVREAAVVQYGQLTDRHNVAPLSTAVTHDPAPAVRAAAAKQLGNLRSWNGTDALIKGLSDPDPFVRDCSYQAIQSIIGVNYQWDADAPAAERAKIIALIRRDLPRFKGAYDYDMRRREEKGHR